MINLFEPNPRKETIGLIKNIFNKKYFYKDKYCALFSKKFSKFQKISEKKIIFGASCSDLIFNIMFTTKHLLKKTLVVVPSNSFPAIPSAVIRAGLNLLVLDIDSTTGNISLDALKKINKKNIGCIFLTHYGGLPVNIDAIKKIVNKETLIFEDCAGALGSFYNHKSSLGSKGDFACWSFDPMKMITCGEGGVAYIKNKKIYESFSENLYLGLKRSQKYGINAASRGDKWWRYQLKNYGTRSVFTEINASIGLPQLDNINKILKIRQEIRNIYLKYLSNQKNIKFLDNNGCIKYSNYFFTIIANDRDRLAKFLYTKGIYSSLRYYPLNKIKIFKKYCKTSDYRGSNYFEKYALNLPMHQGLKNSDVKKVCKMINIFYK